MEPVNTHMDISNDNDDYANVVADYIMLYLLHQEQAGRTRVYESEIFQLLGQELPEGHPDRAFVLRGDTKIALSDTVISLDEYRQKRSKLN